MARKNGEHPGKLGKESRSRGSDGGRRGSGGSIFFQKQNIVAASDAGTGGKRANHIPSGEMRLFSPDEAEERKRERSLMYQRIRGEFYA